MDPETIEIRSLDGLNEFQACVDLQCETWGEGFSDVVPPSVLKVAQRVGGVVLGAFGPDRNLVGFVFGLTGVERGRIVHWSDMLAVRPEARNIGVGRRLKEEQRKVVRELGGDVIYWTFDPLVGRNAHLNLNKLGVRVSEYVVDMYGITDSHAPRRRPDGSSHRGVADARRRDRRAAQRVGTRIGVARLLSVAGRHVRVDRRSDRRDHPSTLRSRRGPGRWGNVVVDQSRRSGTLAPVRSRRHAVGALVGLFSERVPLGRRRVWGEGGGFYVLSRGARGSGGSR